jgi:hypothetical protein
MPSSIVADLLDMMPHTVTAQPGALDAFGEWTASGEALSLTCMVEGQTRLVRDSLGREVASTMQVIVGGSNGLTVSGHRYTLPAGYSPRTDLTAIGVEKLADENGAHHEVILLP